MSVQRGPDIISMCACGKHYADCGGGDTLGRGEWHRAHECGFSDPTYLLTRVLWRVGRFFSSAAQKVPPRPTPKVIIFARKSA
jgi:hypothetical protein